MDAEKSTDNDLIDEAFIDRALDSSGFGCFQLITIPACGLAATI